MTVAVAVGLGSARGGGSGCVRGVITRGRSTCTHAVVHTPASKVVPIKRPTRGTEASVQLNGVESDG